MGPSWANLEPPWRPHGPTWGLLEPCVAHLGPTWSLVGLAWGLLSVFLIYLGPSGSHLGDILGPSCEQSLLCGAYFRGLRWFLSLTFQLRFSCPLTPKRTLSLEVSCPRGASVGTRSAYNLAALLERRCSGRAGQYTTASKQVSTTSAPAETGARRRPCLWFSLNQVADPPQAGLCYDYYSLTSTTTATISFIFIFAPKTAPSPPKTIPRPPKTAPRWPKDGSKRAHDGSKTAQDRPKTHPRRPETNPKTFKKQLFSHGFCTLSLLTVFRFLSSSSYIHVRAQDGPKTAQDGPKTAQDSPKTAQDGPKMAPRRLEDGPKTPKTAQDEPQTFKKLMLANCFYTLSFLSLFCHHLGPILFIFAPKTAPRSPKTAPRPPKMAPRRPQDVPNTASRRPHDGSKMSPRCPQDRLSELVKCVLLFVSGYSRSTVTCHLAL